MDVFANRFNFFSRKTQSVKVVIVVIQASSPYFSETQGCDFLGQTRGVIWI